MPNTADMASAPKGTSPRLMARRLSRAARTLPSGHTRTEQCKHQASLAGRAGAVGKHFTS